MSKEYEILKQELNRLFKVSETSYTTNLDEKDKIIYIEGKEVLKFPASLISLCNNEYWTEFVHLITSYDTWISHEYYIVNVHDLLLGADDLIIDFEEKGRI